MIFEKLRSHCIHAVDSGDVLLVPVAGKLFFKLYSYKSNVASDIVLLARVCNPWFENYLVKQGDLLHYYVVLLEILTSLNHVDRG